LQNGRAGPSQKKDIAGVVLEKALGKSPASDFSAGSQISQSPDVRSPLPEAQVDEKSQVRLSLRWYSWDCYIRGCDSHQY
ncbi:hypothetical protein, partial [Pseudomonas fulva]|uniref:hypothetical protein n=1 Tax=Pseudomonas fulva TaxID=47880 RepID=UPI002B1CE8EE